MSHLLLPSPRQHLRALAPALGALVVALTALPEGGRVWLGALTTSLLAAGLIAQLGTVERHRFADWALAAAAGGYVGALLGLAVVLRASPDGFAWTLLALVVTWAYDSLAFLTGRSIGRHGFMTHISPRKTWEGVAGGTAASIAVTAAFLPFLPIEGWQVVPIGSGLGRGGADGGPRRVNDQAGRWSEGQRPGDPRPWWYVGSRGRPAVRGAGRVRRRPLHHLAAPTPEHTAGHISGAPREYGTQANRDPRRNRVHRLPNA